MLDAGSTTLTCFTLYPAFALVSMNITFSSLAFLSPSSMDTCLGEDNTESEKKTRRPPRELRLLSLNQGDGSYVTVLKAFPCTQMAHLEHSSALG